MSVYQADSKVDLCGELGHPDDDFAELALTDEFGFSCAGCGGCCRDRQDIVLSGYDLWRLAAHLSVPPQVVINGFCRLYTGRVSKMPVVRLNPDKNGNCPFLYQNRCSVHSSKPLVCALYPLGQTIELNGKITYFVQDTGCGGPRMHFLLKDYLDQFAIRDREGLDLEWARLNLGLSKRMRNLPEGLTPLRLKVAHRRIVHALYLDYDPKQPYEPQLRKNLDFLFAELDKLLGPDPNEKP